MELFVISWNFEQKFDQLLLVSIVDETLFDFAELDSGLHRDAKIPILLKIEESKENIDTKEPELLEPIEKEPVTTTKSNITSDTESNEKQTQALMEEAPDKIEKAPKQTGVEEKVSEDISRPGYDFGSARWGMTKAQVAALERSSLISDSANSLKYNGRYNGTNTRLYYVFSGNKLLRGRYLISGTLADKQAYITSYENIK
ncbi:MAG: hypothetical protein GWN56_00200, partial [Nitrosopumilaceae archaeon]|nr:hypothetical protein [Nitrosopumilaceae archaeon]